MKRSTSWIAVLPSLVIPLSLGMTMYLGLSYLLAQQYIDNQLLVRYLTGHPISQVTVAMFFVGVASLAAIAKNVFEQFSAERQLALAEPADLPQTDESTATTKTHASGQTTWGENASAYLERLEQFPAWIQDHYLWQRLAGALAHIQRTGAAHGVEEEMKYLGDLDLDRQQQRYSLVRILIWATPMLGFLGTVLGISEALGGIQVGPDNDFQAMMDGLRGSLYVAFDTTALALTLSMVLMFAQFLVDRFEAQLLDRVDQRARGEIARYFDLSTTGNQVGAEHVQSLTQQLLKASRQSVDQQIDVWKKTIRSAEQAWSSSLTEANGVVQENLSQAIDENVNSLAHYLGEAIEKADEAMSHRWQQWQVMLSDNARAMADHQLQLAEQTSQLEQLIQKQQGTELFQEALEQNQQAIVATRELRGTLESLSEAVQGLPVAGPIETASPVVPKEGIDRDALTASLLVDVSLEEASLAHDAPGKTTEFIPAAAIASQQDRMPAALVEHADDQPAIIRFEPYLSAQQESTPSSYQGDTEVILPLPTIQAEDLQAPVDSAEVVLSGQPGQPTRPKRRLEALDDTAARTAEFLSSRQQRRAA